MKMKKFFTFFTSAFAVSLCFARLGFCAEPLDIKEAVRLALRDNSSLRSLRQDIIKAEAFKLQADGTLLPSISLNGTLDTQREPQTTDGSDRSSSRSATASLEQVIYSGGQNSALRAQSPQMKTIAELAIADGENAAAGELYSRFYNVLLQKKQIEAELDAVTTSEVHLKEVSKRAELGLSNKLEVIRASQQLASNNASLATARGTHQTAVISLMNYLAIEPKNRREATGALYEPKIEESKEQSLKTAQQFRADRRQLEEQLNYQKNQVKIERSAMMPKVMAGVTSSWLNPYNNQDRSDDTWSAQLTLDVPIFDRNVTRSAVMSANAVREQDKIALEQKELDIKSEIETAWSDIESTRQSLRASEEALELAKESLRLAQVGYREGVTPQLDLLEAQSSLTSAQLDYNKAQYDHLMAVVALKVTEGIIVEWTGALK